MKETKSRLVNSIKYTGFFGIIVVLFIYLQMLFRIYYADVCFENAVRSIDRGEYDIAVVYVNQAIKSNSEEPNYLRLKAKALILISTDATGDESYEYKTVALDSLRKAYELNPNNLVTIRNSVPLYYYLSVHDYSLPPSVDNLDDRFIRYAADFFETVKERYSHDVGVITLIAKYENRLGLYEEYNDSVSLVEKLRPDLLDWHTNFN
ncbi:hypothetical protein JXA34_03975 [Patescibacteria group bacterium]|nr:hypothetical protein [Patescibacteria group bacterium]